MKEYYSFNEFAELVGVSVQSLYKAKKLEKYTITVEENNRKVKKIKAEAVKLYEFDDIMQEKSVEQPVESTLIQPTIEKKILNPLNNRESTLSNFDKVIAELRESSEKRIAEQKELYEARLLEQKEQYEARLKAQEESSEKLLTEKQARIDTLERSYQNMVETNSKNQALSYMDKNKEQESKADQDTAEDVIIEVAPDESNVKTESIDSKTESNKPKGFINKLKFAFSKD